MGKKSWIDGIKFMSFTNNKPKNYEEINDAYIGSRLNVNGCQLRQQQHRNHQQ